MKYLIIPLISFFSVSVSAQENVRSERRFGFGIQLGGPTLVTSLESDYFITRNINLEAGIGIIGFYGGTKWYFGAKNKPMYWAPYVGACYIALPDDILGGDWKAGGYFPIGLQYLSKKGFTFAGEVAGLLHQTAQTPVFGALKMGYHF